MHPLTGCILYSGLCSLTGFGSLTLHCLLFTHVGWTTLSTCRFYHWYSLIYEAILGLYPPYLLSFAVTKSSVGYFLHSDELILLIVHKICTNHGKILTVCCSFRMEMQQELKLKDLICFNVFKAILYQFVN